MSSPRVATRIQPRKREGRRKDQYGFERGEMEKFEAELSVAMQTNPRYRRERRAFNT